MRVSPVLLHKHFGNLGKVRALFMLPIHFSVQVYGQYRFGLAPNEQKPFKGFFDHAVVRVRALVSSFNSIGSIAGPP